MSRTVLDIDRDLLAQAKRILGQRTITATLNEALRRVVAERAREELFDYVDALDAEQRAAVSAARE